MSNIQASLLIWMTGLQLLNDFCFCLIFHPVWEGKGIGKALQTSPPRTTRSLVVPSIFLWNPIHLFNSSRAGTWARSPTWDRDVVMTGCWGRSGKEYMPILRGKKHHHHKKQKNKTKQKKPTFQYVHTAWWKKGSKEKNIPLLSYFWVAQSACVHEWGSCNLTYPVSFQFIPGWFSVGVFMILTQKQLFPWTHLPMNILKHSQDFQWLKSKSPILKARHSFTSLFLHHLLLPIYTATV